jgi:hypothetical protein
MVSTPKAAPVATDEELLSVAELERFPTHAYRACYNLSRQCGAAQPPAPQPASPPAPAGGLVERVAKVIAASVGPPELWCDDARAAIREVAAWVDQQGQHGCSLLLREEADR